MITVPPNISNKANPLMNVLWVWDKITIDASSMAIPDGGEKVKCCMIPDELLNTKQVHKCWKS